MRKVREIPEQRYNYHSAQQWHTLAVDLPCRHRLILPRNENKLVSSDAQGEQVESMPANW